MNRDKWNSTNWLTANSYEMYKGTEDITSPAGLQLILQSDLKSDIERSINVLDLGFGLGQISQQIIKFVSDIDKNEIRIVAGDTDDSLLEGLKIRKRDQQSEGWNIVNVEKIDANAIDRPNDTFDYIYCNFLYFLLKDPINGLQESIRVLKSGGTLSFSTWAYSGPFQLLQHAIALFPSYPLTPSPPSGSSWTHPQSVRKILEEHKLKDIIITPFEFFQYADNPRQMAKKMWPVVKVISSRWGEQQGELGWKVFEKIEELLKRDQGDEEVKIASVALIVTAKKP
ncbi:uncharacterized protein I206_105715 [Kwoniella pini CBS 10737]|uniref:Methyltransferase type 11 domain-containing protein n=1 Tax=Kwoniella pini CBS 10737 TaxID=1296096 RepID=A0A1B9I3F6_9TREE|nr:uncharacterized protein I206_03382 [Kwoniella pini CBS 10737]OCF50066.1 hypothetical protein I206_03382 [Kwoniella pini CBS 10737]